ncbi:conserved hypothetical protein [Neospora caninum Liverpool]|uniref:Uncharacterized protein n=1 Tax=Neospora caninum (strain Liverpool) TaxID=572307 RepID=F0VBS7_NEOCL|nr:conserved hypothetical protein [Neospora caninum Liverpool]CBZ51061.1 conserved hypothetical protein [Neospora caninum Liverpool]CEL68368.1 TPA: hypothetical protein BN1204_041360 [Neospora caninum Liverpool]|eukprot:XP_003881094.1 conserved hypothetical protein [Neospora caninum Liverpool]
MLFIVSMKTKGGMEVYSAFKSMTPHRTIDFKGDTLWPTSSQEGSRRPPSATIDSWDVFVTPLDDLFRKHNKHEVGRSHGNLGQPEGRESFEDTQEATSRSELLLQALQAVEVNFYRQSSLLLRYVE